MLYGNCMTNEEKATWASATRDELKLPSLVIRFVQGPRDDRQSLEECVPFLLPALC